MCSNTIRHCEAYRSLARPWFTVTAGFSPFFNPNPSHCFCSSIALSTLNESENTNNLFAGSIPIESYSSLNRPANSLGEPESWRRPVQRSARSLEDLKSWVRKKVSGTFDGMKYMDVRVRESRDQGRTWKNAMVVKVSVSAMSGTSFSL